MQNNATVPYQPGISSTRSLSPSLLTSGCTHMFLLALRPTSATTQIVMKHHEILSVSHPPAFRMYTPPPCSYISIKCMKGREGQVVKAGDGKRCQEGLYIIFFLNETWGGPALHKHKTIFGKPQKCIPLGVSCYYELSIHCKLKI